jgi:hypothetical protein
MEWIEFDMAQDRDQLEGSCEHGYIKCWQIVLGLHNWRLLEMSSAS